MGNDVVVGFYDQREKPQSFNSKTLRYIAIMDFGFPVGALLAAPWRAAFFLISYEKPQSFKGKTLRTIAIIDLDSP